MKKWNPIFFAVGVIVVGYMIYDTGVDVIMQNVKKTGIWFLPVVGIWFVVYLINALSWSAILYDKNTPKDKLPSFPNVFRITVSGFAINYITPMVSLGGEPYRIVELNRKLDSGKSTSKVLSYSMMHILSHIVFWIVSIVLIIVLLNPPKALVLGCSVALGCFFVVFYYMIKGYRKGLIVKLFRILGKMPVIKNRVNSFSEKKMPVLMEIDQNIIALYSQRKLAFFAALFCEILARAVSCLEILFIARAIDMNITVLDSIVLYAGSTLFYNIMFFSPMQLGTREGGIALTLSAMGLYALPGTGIYIGLVMRIRELFWICVGIIFMKFRF